MTAVHFPGRSTVLVGDVAKFANKDLADRNERIVLTPHAVGRILAPFDISGKRTNKGYSLKLDEELRRTVHVLVKRYGMDCNAAEMLPESSKLGRIFANCSVCNELQLITEGDATNQSPKL
jgi:hypothetical protein